MFYLIATIVLCCNKYIEIKLFKNNENFLIKYYSKIHNLPNISLTFYGHPRSSIECLCII